MIKVITEIEDSQWNDLVNKSAVASYFQTYECYKFYKALSFLEPFLFAISENKQLKGVIVGYIEHDKNPLKQFLTRRAIILGGPLLSNDISDDALKLLLKTCSSDLHKKAIYIEQRNFNDYSKWKSIFENCNFKYQLHLNFHLKISDYDTVLSNLKSNKRRYIKLSIKENVNWHVTTDEKEISDLYNILKNLYTQKVKTPLFPLSFFIQLSKCTNSKFIVVMYNNKVVGGGVFVVFLNRCIYEWFVCGEDRKYKNVYPSICATWSGIEYATKNGIPLFDFMGAGKPDVEYGVREFKAEFGGDLLEQGRFTYICKPVLYEIGKLGVKILKKIK